MAGRTGFWPPLRALLASVLVWPVVAAAQLPAFEQVRADWRASDIAVFDRHGQLLESLRQDFSVRRGRWLSLAEISPVLQKAVILSEDRRFYEHGGVDWLAVLSASRDWLSQGRPRGASTLSMQLAGMLDAGLPAPGRRSVADKLRQAAQARALEARWSKSQILEAYLNLAAFRGEWVGIDAVSRHLFGKQAHGLNARESALAAALLRGPAVRASALAQARARTAGLFPEPARAPHFARLALAQARQHGAAPGDEMLFTTLDAGLQARVQASVRRHLGPLARAGVSDAAVVVLHNASGEIRAYLGSSGDASQAPFVDHARALRQAGSALKPFLYAQAVDRRMLTAASLLDNRALGLEVGGGLYVPKNYDESTSGWVSVRQALASSLNLPAVRTLTLVGVPSFVHTLRRLGLPLERRPDFYGYSLALGSADVSLLSLVNAYRALAAGGCYRAWHALKSGQAARQASVACTGDAVFSNQAAWIIGHILSDRQARAHTFGLDSALSTPFWSAAKTGTSKDMRDNWTVGWNSEYTVGVWVGNSQGESMREVSGVTGAGPIWHEIMRGLDRDRPGTPAAMPDGLVVQRVQFAPGTEAARDEVFLAGTQMAQVQPAEGPGLAASVRILAPEDGLTLALDPGIPARHQRLALQASVSGPAGESLSWSVNGRKLGRGARQWWAPLPGRHRIDLLDGRGQVLASAHLRVQGSQTDPALSGPRPVKIFAPETGNRGG